jgi:hypothetical protein
MELQTTFGTINQALKNTFKAMTDEVQQCIENCLQCHRTCEQLIPYCLEKGGMHAERSHIQLLSTCADICRTSAHFMMWSSDLHPKVCGTCAEACLKCAEDCERMGDDKMMKACAEICRLCAESCQKMATRH